MCLIVFAWQSCDGYPLVLAANRDEFYHRPTRSLREWPESHGLYAGKDLRAGGTWLGLSRNGRFAAVTNYRELAAIQNYPRSRGELPQAFLQGDMQPERYLEELASSADEYNGFNLLIGDRRSLWYFSNRSTAPPCELPPGIYGLSNALLDTPWPKLRRCRRKLEQMTCSADHDALIRILHDRIPAADEALPDTGVGTRLERLLSPVFIRSAVYGTRASTALSISENGEARMTEQGYWRYGIRTRRRQVRLRLQPHL